jgi:hypothetical protein
MALSKVDVESGGTGLIAAGTSGNVLTSDGTNWASEAPAGGGGTKLLETFTNSATPNMDFVAFNHTLYDSYEIFFTSQHATSNASWQILVSTDGGSSWSGSNVYDIAAARVESGGGSNSNYAENGVTINFSGDVTNNAGERTAGYISLISPGDGYMTSGLLHTTSQVHNGKFEYRGGGWRYGSTTAVNGIRIRTQSGTNNASYIGRMYGRLK